MHPSDADGLELPARRNRSSKHDQLTLGHHLMYWWMPRSCRRRSRRSARTWRRRDEAPRTVSRPPSHYGPQSEEGGSGWWDPLAATAMAVNSFSLTTNPWSPLPSCTLALLDSRPLALDLDCLARKKRCGGVRREEEGEKPPFVWGDVLGEGGRKAKGRDDEAVRLLKETGNTAIVPIQSHWHVCLTSQGPQATEKTHINCCRQILEFSFLYQYKKLD